MSAERLGAQPRAERDALRDRDFRRARLVDCSTALDCVPPGIEGSANGLIPALELDDDHFDPRLADVLHGVLLRRDPEWRTSDHLLLLRLPIRQREATHAVAEWNHNSRRMVVRRCLFAGTQDGSKHTHLVVLQDEGVMLGIDLDPILGERRNRCDQPDEHDYYANHMTSSVS